MAEIQEPIKIGNYWTNIISGSTGESVNFEEVSEWYDGSDMDDSKADGVIYRKLPASAGGGYVRRALGTYGQILQKSTMSEMRSLSGTEQLLLLMGYYVNVQLNGYYEDGDTPSPVDYFVSDSADPDNGGSIVHVSGSSMVLEHDFLGYINIYYFGGGENVDNSGPLTNALGALPDFGGEVHFPEGTFPFETTVIFPSVSMTAIKNATISGSNNISNHSAFTSANSRGITVLAYEGSGALLDMRLGSQAEVVSSCTLRDFNARYVGESSGTIGVNIWTFTRGSLKNICMHSFDTGITIGSDSYYSMIEEVKVTNSSVVGMDVNGLLNGTALRRCSFNGSAIGLRVVSGGRSAVIEGCWTEGNDIGIRVDNLRQITFMGCYFENSSVSHLDIAVSNPSVSPTVLVNIIGSSFRIDNNTESAIRVSVQGSPKTINLIGNSFGNQSDNAASIVRSLGGTAEFIPSINEVGTTWYSGIPVPTQFSATGYVRLGEGRVRISGAEVLSGVGDPNGTITAPRGSVYIRTSASDNAHYKIYTRRSSVDNEWAMEVSPRMGSTASRPTTPMLFLGEVYFDTTINRPVWWNGSNWVNGYPQTAASANTASAVGSEYNQAEVQAILTELRDLKTKMRAAGLLAT